MSDHPPSLILPAHFSQKTRVVLRESDDRLELTDGRGVRLAKVIALLLTVGAGGFGLVLMGLIHLSQLYGNSTINSHRAADIKFEAVGLFAFGGFMLLLWLAIMLTSGLHRCFRVRVDFFQRRCVCESRVFGIPFRKRETDLNRAEWDVGSAHHQFTSAPESSWANSLATVILFFMGPLGWIIARLTSSGRNAKGSARVTTVEVAHLRLREEEAVVAQIAVPEEDIAERFLLAWDRWADRRPTRR